MGEITSYLIQMALPALVGGLLWAATRPWRRRRLARKGRRPGPYRERALLLFFMFLAGLLALTLTPAGFWDAVLAGRRPQMPPPFQGGVNLSPLRRSWQLLCYYVRNDLWAAVWVNFPGNIVMFMPVGFFAGLLLDKPRWWKGTLLTAGVSLFIEIFQLFVSRGTDVDDLILNTLGGFLGHLAFRAFHRLFTDIAIKCGTM